MMQLISNLVAGLVQKRGNIPSLKLQKHQSGDNTAEHAIRSSRKSRATTQTLMSAPAGFRMRRCGTANVFRVFSGSAGTADQFTMRFAVGEDFVHTVGYPVS